MTHLLHTLWSMLPTLAYLIVVGAVVFVAGWWATIAAEDHDDWVFFGGQGAEHNDER